MDNRRRLPRPGLRGYRLLAAVVAGVTAFFLIRAFTGPGPNALEEAPPEILGRWSTTDQRYAERAFIIEDEFFHLEVGQDSVLSYRIAVIERFDGDDFDRYVLTYHTREGEAVQEFRLRPDGQLRLKNPPDVIWTRR